MAIHNKKQPFKVQKNGKKYGIVAQNFDELKTAGCRKLDLQAEEIEVITLEDDTIVDDRYFQTLNPNTVLIFKEKQSKYDIEELVKKFRRALETVSDADIQQYLKKQNSDSTVGNFLRSFQSINNAEEREKDDLWFKDVPARYQTKSHYMRERAKNRIRTYFQLTKNRLLPKDPPDDTCSEDVKKRAHDVIKELDDTLKDNDYHGKIFDRTDTTEQRLCNKKGEFDCQGPYDMDNCGIEHRINPYSRKDLFIEFSSWNLDHQIEKSKEVIPQLKEAVEKSSKRINVEYFYELLFTMENLKLVHTACHDKTDHKLTVDQTKVFL